MIQHEEQWASRLDRLLHKRHLLRARSVAHEALKVFPDSHLLLIQLSATYYMGREYAKAFEIIEQARSLAPRCPNVLWDYAGLLDALGRSQDAIPVYKSLLRRDFQKLCTGECGNGRRLTRALLNDCRYRLAGCYSVIGRHDLAMKWYRLHLKHRAPGIPSLYDLKSVRRGIREYYVKIKDEM